ncbi:NAD(P)H-dependent oxidoreductase [Oscillibacter sp. MSJ-2]|uniref:NAD(P)H-dependent oxidoreductase n=1 Tax=Dysosmobacter acutus TaxID=2841504 RepID=A0ABS6F6Q2_9FIRM|nr:NAD(P)H-dependent oxidoreductase [Dysosmobacter acutus]MBU5625969.1 NAD(P)H-dependent oxidoreductase [Dysosmobacter acutus]
MKQALFVDCCVREEQSRTRKMADAFFAALPDTYEVTRLDLMHEGLGPLVGEYFWERERLIRSGELSHDRFRYARQLAQANLVVFAAPFWDLGFPALLKIYIEQVCVDGITFGYDAQGLHGLCRAEHCVFLTTRGGCYDAQPELEQGSRYLDALHTFFGFGGYTCVAADGLDIEGADASAVLERACRQAKELAMTL